MVFFIAFTEAREFRISKQHSLSYLPLIVLEEQKIVEKNAKKAGLKDIKVSWVDANENGADLISSDTASFLRLWDKTEVKAVASLDRSHIVLNSSNPRVKRLRDFTDKDKIALSKASLSALVLQIVASKEFGIENYDKLDRLSVDLNNFDAFTAFTSNKSEITAHVTTEPFAFIEQKNRNIHQVFNSNDLAQSGFSLHLIFASEKFYNENQEFITIFINSLQEANSWIKNNKKEAAKLYVKAVKESADLIEKTLNSRSVHYDAIPVNVTFFSDFLHDTGVIGSKPKLEELFFDEIFRSKACGI
jgi:NitT/TauT family transport system substrate-binding protein